MNKILLLILLVLSCEANAQQDTITKLRMKLAVEKVDSLKYKLMTSLAYEYANFKRDSAFYFFLQSIDLAKRTGDKKAEVKANIRYARMHFDINHYSRALQLSLRNLELSEKYKDTNGMYFETRLQMWIYGKVQDYDKQLEYGKKLFALANTKAIKESKIAALAMSSAYNGIGMAYQNRKQFDSAYVNFHKSLKTRDSSGKNPQLRVVASYFADYFQELKMLDSSLFYSRIAIKNYVGRSDMLAQTAYDMGNIFYLKKQLDSALIYARRSFRTASSVPDSATIAKSAFLLADIYRDRKMTDSAYSYLNQAVDIKKDLDAREEINKAGTLFFKKNMHLKELEQQKEQDESQYRSNLKIYSLFGGITVLLLVSTLFYRNSKRRQKDAARIRTSYDKLRKTQSQLIQAEKMASLGELTAGIAHEIQNPLNFVNNFSDVSMELLDEISEERKKQSGERDEKLEEEILSDIRQNLEKISHHGRRADSIVKGMLQHSRASSGEKELTDLNALAEEYLRLAYHGLRAKDKSFNADLVTNFDPNLPKAKVISQDFGRVLLNLFTNAFYATHERQKREGQSFRPILEVSTLLTNSNIEIHVKDNGTGIPDSIKEKILQPFFTTKPTGEGTGLGLSLSYDIVVKGHGGEIIIESKEGAGSEFIIQLPVK